MVLSLLFKTPNTTVQKNLFNSPLSGTTRISPYQKGKTILDLPEQEIVSGSGISWAICKSAPHPRQITIPGSHRSVLTARMPFLLPNQQCQSTEGNPKDNTTEHETPLITSCYNRLQKTTDQLQSPIN